MRSGCKRIALWVKERSHEQVFEAGAMGGSGNAVVGSALVFRSAGWIACVGDHWPVFGLGIGSGEVPSVSCARAFLFVGAKVSG